jgi:hypothetical protein
VIVARGWVSAQIYYATVAISVYLLAVRYVGVFSAVRWQAANAPRHWSAEAQFLDEPRLS